MNKGDNSLKLDVYLALPGGGLALREAQGGAVCLRGTLSGRRCPSSVPPPPPFPPPLCSLLVSLPGRLVLFCLDQLKIERLLRGGRQGALIGLFERRKSSNWSMTTSAFYTS